MPSALVRSIARGIGARVSRTTDTTADALAWSDYGWAVPTASGVMVSQASAMQVSAVYACVCMLSYDLAKLGASIFQGKRRGSRQKAKSHPIYPLFTTPAPWLTWFEFCGMMQMSVLLRGNGYAVILRDPYTGRPAMLVPVNPDRVALWEAPDGALFYMVTRSGLHEMAVLAKEPLLIEAENVFHLKALTANGLLGLSPISLEREAIGLAIAQEQLAARWAGNGAQPRGILTTDQKLSKEAAERMHDDWKRLHGGLYNAGKTAVFEGGLKWQALSLSSHDMEFLAARKFQLAEIARIFRVPLYKLGADEHASRGTAIPQQAQEYLNDSLSTWIEMWEQRIAFTFGLNPDEMFVEFDVDRLLRADIQTRYAANRIALGGTGWMKMNEVRADEGLDPVEGGDTVYRPLNTAPTDSDVFAGQPDPDDPTVPGDDNTGAAAPGSDQTGQKGEGGGRPPAKGIQKKPL